MTKWAFSSSARDCCPINTVLCWNWHFTLSLTIKASRWQSRKHTASLWRSAILKGSSRGHVHRSCCWTGSLVACWSGTAERVRYIEGHCAIPSAYRWRQWSRSGTCTSAMPGICVQSWLTFEMTSKNRNETAWWLLRLKPSAKTPIFQPFSGLPFPPERAKSDSYLVCVTLVMFIPLQWLVKKTQRVEKQLYSA